LPPPPLSLPALLARSHPPGSNLPATLLETEVPVAITRHGDTIGYYIPARRKRTEAERTALKEVAARLQQVLAAEGISEEEILKDFKQWRVGGRK
jgi:hypothetical protein